MRIAEVAPPHESVPPKLYGGTERVVHYLTEELVAQGHDVTLFASGDSETSARLVRSCDRALRLDRREADGLAFTLEAVESAYERSCDFDIIHFHVDLLHFPAASREFLPSLTTIHNDLHGHGYAAAYRRFHHLPLISISDEQRAPLPFARWVGTIHHGLPENLLPFAERSEGYLAFLGRVSPEKRVDRAVEIARLAGRPLKVAAKVDALDQDYFCREIAPLMAKPWVEFVGEISEKEKASFLGKAAALLFPVDWPEPFGLVMIEAMSCGTPVIAWNCGSVPEVIETGRSGIIVDSIEKAVKATHMIEELDRFEVRRAFLERFTSKKMAMDYLDSFRLVIDQCDGGMIGAPLGAVP